MRTWRGGVCFAPPTNKMEHQPPLALRQRISKAGFTPKHSPPIACNKLDGVWTQLSWCHIQCDTMTFGDTASLYLRAMYISNGL